jgi:histidinol-phosphate aminotransferase
LGYLLGHASLIGPIVDKTRDSYNVNHISQQIGLAAISDQAYARSTWDEVRRSRSQLLNQLDLPSPPTQTNFILVTVGRGAKLNAQALYEALKERGILVRHFTAERLSDKLRITVGTQEQNQALLTELTDLLS